MAERTLILSVDRDDDLGRKVNISGPIIGRRENLRAAMALGLKDPEDSDTNTILMALKEYDDRVAEGEEVEIATITGDRSVGRTSDRELNRQLDAVIQEVQPDSIILVTDGAEDSEILPLLYSRHVPIARIKTVIVRQAKNLEGWWVMLNRLIDDKGVRNTILLPTSMFFLLLAVVVIFKVPEIGAAAFFFFLGVFTLVKVFKQEETLKNLQERMAATFQTGSIRGLLMTVLVVVLLYGLLDSYYRSRDYFLTDNRWDVSGLIFTETFLGYVVGVLIMYYLGSVAQETVRTRHLDLLPLAVVLLSGIMFFLFTRAIVHVVMLSIDAFVERWTSPLPTRWDQIFVEFLGGGICWGLVFMINRYGKDRGGNVDEAAWRV